MGMNDVGESISAWRYLWCRFEVVFYVGHPHSVLAHKMCKPVAILTQDSFGFRCLTLTMAKWLMEMSWSYFLNSWALGLLRCGRDFFCGRMLKIDISVGGSYACGSELWCTHLACPHGNFRTLMNLARKAQDLGSPFLRNWRLLPFSSRT
jgi:hypothetical protein